MVILIVLLELLGALQGHLIISVTSTNDQVNANQLITLKILTTAPVPPNSLQLNLTADFTLNLPCSLNGTNTPCTLTTSTSSVSALFSTALANNTYYLLTLNATNPAFATNFPISATASNTPFTNQGLITITPKTITCTMTASSNFVGDTAVGYFILNNDPLPSGAIITINSSLQTTFNNLFAPSPICEFSTGTAPCSLSTSFSQQLLTINGVPSNSALSFNVSLVNNAPYNASMIEVSLQIQNSNSYYMQVCSFNQPTPTQLRPSSTVSLKNWNNSIGAVSNVTLTINTYFTPFSSSAIFIYDSNLTATPNSPTTQIQLIQNGNNSMNYLTAGTAIGRSLSFYFQITNPPTQQPLILTFYVIYSTSLFIQTYQTSAFTLSPLTFPLSVTIMDNRTMTNTIYNSTTTLPYNMKNSTTTLTLTAGAFQCSDLTLSSSASLTLSSCNNNSITLTGPLPTGPFWISFRVMNYFSVRNDNYLSLNITGPAPSYYLFGTATTTVSLTPNNQTFTLNNHNTTFAAPTSFTLTETTIALSNNALRVFTITLPSDLQINTSTTVTTTTNATTLANYSINTNTILLSIYGSLNIHINYLSNPIKYLGSTRWTITATDNINNPSSSGTATQTIFYTPATSTASILLSNQVIESQATLTLTVIPSLHYYFTPNITTAIPNSVLQNVCDTCTIQSISVFTFTYFAAVMKVNVTLKNSLSPQNNSITLIISTGNITFETLTLNYTLQPMTFNYISFQTGFFGELGTLNLTITSTPSTPTTLTYSPLTPILSSPNCYNCNNTQIIANGIVQYFQTTTITLTGTSNGIIYATARALVSYICASIQGCRICTNQSGTLVCQQCFTSEYTPYSLLYNSQCLQSCPISTYSNSLTCVNCNTNCQNCDSQQCNLCTLNYFIYNGTCLAACPAPLVNNATHCISVPVICPNHCANCPASHICLACDGGYLLLSNLCYSSCPKQYIPNKEQTTCLLFIPPQETPYFPFPFTISAALLTIALLAIKCYEKRSLIMGNLIAFLSIVEIGSMFMTLIYSLQSNSDLLTQALCFILLFSKVLLNLIFLAYFCKTIATQPDFERWREQEETHQNLYRALVVLSSTFSFQTIRIIYSRLLGLRIFFGKFNTALIFKPLNFFTIAHFTTSGFALVFLSIRNIIASDGYKTSSFYSSIQSIILETLLLITCIIDNKKGYDDQFFEYQVYKVKNQYESSHIQPVEIEEQEENVCSMHEMLNAVQSGSPRKGKSALIVKNQMWVKKPEEPLPSFQNIEIQSDIIEEQSIKNLKKNNEDLQGKDKIKDSILRRKMIQDWRKLQKTLPKNLALLRFRPKENLQEQIEKRWVSPNQKKRIQKSMKKASSVVQMEIQLPKNQSSIPEKIKQYFTNRSTYIKPAQALKKTPIYSHRKQKRQRKLNKEGNFIEQNCDQQNQRPNQLNNVPEQSSTMELQKKIISLSPRSGSEKEEMTEQVEKEEDWSANQQKTYADSAVGPNKRYHVKSRHGKLKPELDQLEQHYQQQQDQFEQSSQDNGELELRGNESQKRFNHKKQPPQDQQLAQKDIKLQYQSNPRLKSKLPPGYKCDDSQIKQKRYRTKKRRVNRLTEEVYLQRLFGSSQKKTRLSKNRKMDF